MLVPGIQVAMLSNVMHMGEIIAEHNEIIVILKPVDTQRATEAEYAHLIFLNVLNVPDSRRKARRHSRRRITRFHHGKELCSVATLFARSH